MRRDDWPEIKASIDLEAVLAEHLGPARVARGSKLKWLCPFHDDHDPSLVLDRARGTWRCWACGVGGDAAEFVKLRTGLSFPEVIAVLAGDAPSVERAVPRAVEAMRKKVQGAAVVDEKPDGKLDGILARNMASLAEERLWTPDGRAAQAYLCERGLTYDTIKDAGLGYVERARSIPWRPDGITIPWFEWGRLVYLNVRAMPAWLDRFKDRPRDQRPPKYLCGFKDGPVLYPSMAAVRPFKPVIVVEGEFDALLLGQELGDLASVVTTGAASEHPGPRLRSLLATASKLFVSTDDDGAGEKAARTWGRGATRVLPPEPFKDWSEAWQGGVDLREFWGPHLSEA